MALISLRVSDVITEKLEVGKHEWGWNIYKPTGIYDLHLNKLLNTNTYMIVFNLTQEKLMVVRSLTSASEGRGISIVPKEELTQHAPLYTEYIPKKKEFRVHVFNNKVIDVQEKRRRRGLDQTQEFKVRNTANGYVFCRNDVVVPDDLHTVALSAVRALGRTQGAVDVVYNEKQNKCFALEVNSRPGLQGTTLKIYADACINYLKGE